MLTNEHRRRTSPWQQVLWGYTWQVQGSNGLNSAQPSHPRGSTLTFQHIVGVSWARGLRHGVTMHPRGRHLREDRTLLPHGKDSTLEREQQPPHQQQRPGVLTTCPSGDLDRRWTTNEPLERPGALTKCPSGNLDQIWLVNEVQESHGEISLCEREDPRQRQASGSCAEHGDANENTKGEKCTRRSHHQSTSEGVKHFENESLAAPLRKRQRNKGKRTGKQRRMPMQKETHCWAVSPRCVHRHVRKNYTCPNRQHWSRRQRHYKLGVLGKKLKMAYSKSGIQQFVKIVPGKELHDHHDNSERPPRMLDCVHGFNIFVLRRGSYLGRCIRGGGGCKDI